MSGETAWDALTADLVRITGPDWEPWREVVAKHRPLIEAEAGLLDTDRLATALWNASQDLGGYIELGPMDRLFGGPDPFRRVAEAIATAYDALLTPDAT